jgi:uncharacterized protein with HEPN domain
MLSGQREAMAFASGRTEADLSSGRMPARSLERQIEIVGEAASLIHASSTRSLFGAPWWKTFPVLSTNWNASSSKRHPGKNGQFPTFSQTC